MSLHSEILELNQNCACFPIARDDVETGILSEDAHPDMADMLATRENYFASTAIFVSEAVQDDMIAQIKAIETAIHRPAFKSLIFGPDQSAPLMPGKGAFMGYDFHITEEGPRLIEINSNAGGAFIVNGIRKALGLPYAATETAIADMMTTEWEAAGRDGTPARMAIIDETPHDQFHYPDMCLAKRLFERAGWQVEILDPSELRYENGHLISGQETIDLIYNRLTDFDLSASDHAHIRQAWQDDAVVLTPHPHHHALYADKQNLIRLTDPEVVDGLGLSSEALAHLGKIPKTMELRPENAAELWAERRNYFFKPFAGFGSRAVYRGAKLTKSKWLDISRGGYVAQALIAPPQRLVTVDGEAQPQKFDVRVYTYDGNPLLMAARIYQGQVTNLRTPGGGLAPVIEMKAEYLAQAGLCPAC